MGVGVLCAYATDGSNGHLMHEACLHEKCQCECHTVGFNQEVEVDRSPYIQNGKTYEQRFAQDHPALKEGR